MSPIRMCTTPHCGKVHGGALFRSQHRRVASKRYIVVASSSDDLRAEQMKAMQDAMSKNPEVMAQVQQQMQSPEAQQQMAQMASIMSNQAFMSRAAELKEDPELKPFFDEIKAGGMAAMMKAMNDPEFLAKIGAKLSDVIPDEGVVPPPPTAAATAAAGPPPEVNNILDAAKYGDIEAVEDYLAIGKGDEVDDTGRTALHYAVAYNQGQVAGILLEGGADVNASDKQGNTALHFAAGYGRGAAVKALLVVGADVTKKNEDGKSPLDIIKEEPRNPLNQETALLDVLEGKSPVGSL